MSHIHRGECTALSVSQDGRYLLTAGDKMVKIWDYNMALDLNFQVHTYSDLDLTEAPLQTKIQLPSNPARGGPGNESQTQHEGLGMSLKPSMRAWE